MDRSLQHAFDAEEIMAYLDGELEPRRAAALAAHLVGCGECQEVAKNFRAVSGRMMNIEVEPAPPQMSETLLRALESSNSSPNALLVGGDKRKIRIRYAWAFAGVLVILGLVVASIPNLFRTKVTPDEMGRAAAMRSYPAAESHLPASKGALPRFSGSTFTPPRTSLPETVERQDENGLIAAAPPPPPPAGELQAPETVGPMIAQTASLGIVATNYDEASAAIERLAAAHGGYVEKLTAKAQTGSARELSAALRIPAKQLDGLLADLSKLGHVEEESRENEEVSAQYVDLQARLKSARATEQRLIELLGTRTGKLSDVLDAERELARIRGEIESMQGQNAVLLHRVSYATVQVDLSEVYRERLSTTSKGTKIRNALVEGFGNLEDGAVGMLIFLLAFGPSMLFWLAVLTLPAWLIWRRVRHRTQA